MSNETNWTPGPWHSGGYPTISAGTGKGMVAKVLERYMDRAEREANANLIALAPELYEVLENIVTELEETGCQGELDSYPQARTALAKARGEQP